jgi:hypothetical protein
MLANRKNACKIRIMEKFKTQFHLKKNQVQMNEILNGSKQNLKTMKKKAIAKFQHS